MGPILTDGLARAGVAAQKAAAAAMPLQRVGQPDEVAAAIVWLCSDQASFITGSTLNIDGGKLARHPSLQREIQGCMSGAAVPANVPPSLTGLQANTLAALVMLLIQYGLGIGANLYLTLPQADHGKSLFPAFGAAVVHGPVVVTLHALLGTLLLGAALGVVIRGLRASRPLLGAFAGIALAAIVVAWLSGASFVGKTTNGASLAMALATGIAILAYVLVLFAIPFGAHRDPSGR